MFSFLRFAAIVFVSLVVPAHPSAAQSKDPSPQELLTKFLRIDEIVEVIGRYGPIVIKGDLVLPDGRIVSGQPIVCDRSNPDREALIIPDHTLKTERRFDVEAGFCEALVAAARRRMGAQGR